MPREEALAAFKALLAEKGVHAFSRYERELPKLQPDKRFKVRRVALQRLSTWGCRLGAHSAPCCH